MQFQDRIDEYLLHPDALSDEDKATFLKEIEEDADKREQYETTQNLIAAIASREDKLKLMHEFELRNDRVCMMAAMPPTGTDCCCAEPDMAVPVGAKPKVSFQKAILWIASGIAAVLVVGFFAINPFIVSDAPSSGIKGTQEIIRGEEDVFDVDTDPISTDALLYDTIITDTMSIEQEYE